MHDDMPRMHDKKEIINGSDQIKRQVLQTIRSKLKS
jgi:hypothetical protein